jgi:hypothetical protein
MPEESQAAPNTQNPWQQLEAAGAEFVSGAPVKVEIDTKGTPLTFTAKNEFGTEYHFTVNGKISIHGKPQ